MGTRRRLALRRRRQNLDQLRGDRVASLASCRGLDRLSRQGIGDEVAMLLVLGDSVAARSDLFDVQRDALILGHPSQLLAGRISPTSKPATLRTGGCRT